MMLNESPMMIQFVSMFNWQENLVYPIREENKSPFEAII